MVYGAAGPRFIAGDWNQTPEHLPETQLWEQEGWVELQRYAQAKWGYEVRTTCKGVSTKDFVYISPELRELLIDVRVDDTWFPDHSILYGIFKPFGKLDPISIWPTIQPIELSHPLPQQDEPPLQGTFPEQTYARLWEAYEHRAHRQQEATHTMGLCPAQRGRAQTMEPTQIHGDLPPPKEGHRHGIVTTYDGRNLQHARWIRQTRRLESLTRILAAPSQTPAHREHAQGLWRSIKKSPGFPQGFLHWSHDPEDTMPDLARASQLRDNMKKKYQEYDTRLRDERVAKAKQTRRENPHKIFSDLRRAKSEQVVALVCPRQATVTHRDTTTGTIRVDNLQALDGNEPLYTSTGLLRVRERQDQDLYLRNEPLPEVGTVVWKEEMIGTPQKIFAAFRTEWEKRWDRHAATDPATWTPFLHWCGASIPQSEDTMPLPPITVDSWKRAVQRKKKTSATGLDQVSRVDLLQLPDDLTECLIDITRRAEKGEGWPQQMMEAAVSAIQKIPDASLTKDFRPITVMSMVYRTWSSIRAKQALTWLAQFAPPGLVGNQPHKTTAKIWYTIQLEIEQALHLGEPLSGYVTDVVKCFNILPRVPVLALAKRFGFPDELIAPWQRSLAQVSRRFKVQGCMGPGLQSSTGFPEGDPLSVVSMVLVNLAAHEWMRQHTPAVEYWSYVDNLETTSSDLDQTRASEHALTEFCTMLDVQLDHGKSFFWSINDKERRQLRDDSKPVQLAARDLGGHMSYCRRKTNRTITQRFAEIRSLWGQLKRSMAPLHQKEASARQVAWPRLFHGCSCVHIGASNYRELRAGLMQGLNHHHAGTNALVQLGLVALPPLDPELYVLLDTVTQFRRNSNMDIAVPILNALSTSPPRNYNPGPCGVLLTRLHEVGWH